MNYAQELDFSDDIICYWESHDMGSRSEYIYPSLPEPYINIYFSLDSNFDILIKGISWKADYLKMNSQLFGVTLRLSGYLQLRLTRSFEISNKLISLAKIGGDQDIRLIGNITNASSFQDRIKIFKDYFTLKKQIPLSNAELSLSEAYNYLLNSYKALNIISKYAEKKELSSRTINRWFVNEIGISPKKLSRVMRFHKALLVLHSYKEAGFYIDVGYFDQAHFIKEFKEFTGQSPEAYLTMVSDLYNQ